MSEINLPPFYVGQKVICVNDKRTDGFLSPIKEGDQFSVKGFWYCGCTWLVDIGIKSICGGTMCYDCKNETFDNIWWFFTFRFAPVQENFQSISLEKVLEEETKLISVN